MNNDIPNEPDEQPVQDKFCIGCHRDHAPEESTDLSGFDDIFMCRYCFEDLRPFERALLTLLAKPVHEGGLQPSGQLDEIEALLKKGGRG